MIRVLRILAVAVSAVCLVGTYKLLFGHPTALDSLIAGGMTAISALAGTVAVLLFSHGGLRRAIALETHTRVTRLPLSIVAIATRGLPEPHRSELRATILGELHAIAENSDGLPITSWMRRTLRSLIFAVDLLRAAPALARCATATPASAAGAVSTSVTRFAVLVDPDIHPEGTFSPDAVFVTSDGRRYAYEFKSWERPHGNPPVDPCP